MPVSRKESERIVADVFHGYREVWERACNSGPSYEPIRVTDEMVERAAGVLRAIAPGPGYDQLWVDTAAQVLRAALGDQSLGTAEMTEDCDHGYREAGGSLFCPACEVDAA